MIINMRQNSKQLKNRTIHKKNEQLETRWATETIEPVWHLIASFQNISQKHLIKNKKEVFQKLQKNVENQKQMQDFVDHCAVLIQSRFKGYMQRKYYKKFLPIYRRFRQLLEAVVAGWRVRKILEMKRIRNRVKKIKQNSYGDRQNRIIKRDLAYDIKELEKKGNWISEYREEFRNKQSKKPVKLINIKRALKDSHIHKDKQIENQGLNKNINLKKSQTYEKELDDESPSQISVRKDSQLEIPIKASGKYQIPSCQESENNEKTMRHNVKKPWMTNKKKEMQERSQKHIKTVTLHSNKKIDKPGRQKQISEIKNKRNSENVQELSHLTISLPVEEQFHEGNNQFNKTLKFKQISIAQTPKNSSTCRNPLRTSEKKGISVTLVRSQRLSDERSQRKLVVSEVKRMEPEKEQERQCVQEESVDPFNEIISVYSNTYKSKRLELERKIEDMKKKSKFSGHSK